ncbi:eukaryotic translation initiation factor 3 subunit F-like [Iris pallida]|uniref:Eukaryotic translation initiation factor 3 subunit F n=1 Tax=Iris pallida TaxID=29817 RepID=A0AAX6GDG6_IRIPA|nr:eukaryotic translation initiation factor 3 subunit F-like [Iris pallida]
MASTVLQFHPSPASATARIQPVVLFSICDSYVRRPDQSDRVIGTLLGSVSADGVIDIRNSYAVPHSESADTVALDIDYHHNMFASHKKVNPTEVIVGWYSTGFGVSGGSALIHEFYSREAANAVHLTVDTSFIKGEASIKAFVSSTLSLADRPLAAQFYEIPLDMKMLEAEKIGFDILKMTMVDKLPNDLEGMEASMERVGSLIGDVYKYVDDVVEGHLAPDNVIGRFTTDTLASVPKMSPAAFDKVLNDKIQDNYALVYLASLTRTQLSIAEKLNTAAQIL